MFLFCHSWLGTILKLPKTVSVDHSIRLRGKWCFATCNPNSTNGQKSSFLQQLPFNGSSGTSASRKWHLPTGMEGEQSVVLSIEADCQPNCVSLNGQKQVDAGLLKTPNSRKESSWNTSDCELGVSFFLLRPESLQQFNEVVLEWSDCFYLKEVKLLVVSSTDGLLSSAQPSKIN